jgi:hypothetical protein
MMPQITPTEREFASKHKADLQAWIDKKTDKGFRSRAESNPALIDELLEHWEKGEAFYISAVVVAPYDGCFHEPNIFLCTPPGSKEYGEFNRHDVNGDRLVWQLYASGQGMCADCLVSLSDIVQWLSEQSLSELATREEGRTSEHRRHHYGSFDSFELHDFGPIDCLPSTETYWASAVRAAEEHYGVALPWTCAQCETVHYGTGESMQEPIHTGYRGNGGVGVFMSGALCYSCYEAGACEICKETSSQPCDVYSEEVAEHGASICDGCTYDLFRGAVNHEEGRDTALATEKLVRVVLQDEKLVVLYDDEEGTPMEGIHIDEVEVDKNLTRWRMRLSQVFGEAGKLILASSLEHISEEMEED